MQKHGFSMRTMIRAANNMRFLALISSIHMLIGVVVFHLLEHVSLFMSWYWSVVTGFTVGYGDIYPHTVGGRLFTIVYIPSSYILLVLLTAGFISHVFVNINEFTHDEQMKMFNEMQALLTNMFDDKEQHDLFRLLHGIDEKVGELSTVRQEAPE